MEKVRVLVVDDSAVVRRLLTDILSADEGIEVADTASSGSLALLKVESVQPDLVTLDVEMPGMGGLETLENIRKSHPKLPVIMFSAFTERAAATTLEALARGASDYVTKPSGTGSREASVAHVKHQLLPKIHALSARPRKKAVPVVRERPVSPLAPRDVDLLLVGASTGGPNALTSLFKALPATFPLPIVVVQHMPPLFTRMLAGRLTETCAVPFVEARGDEVLEPGRGYVAPGDFHLKVFREGKTGRLRIDQDAPIHSCRPSVDALFTSAAEAYGASALAVVLTGMGQDGLAGCRLLREKGAQILVQDEASSVVWGMPGAVAKANLADAVLPLEAMAKEILERTTRSQGAISPGKVAP